MILETSDLFQDFGWLHAAASLTVHSGPGSGSAG